MASNHPFQNLTKPISMKKTNAVFYLLTHSTKITR